MRTLLTAAVLSLALCASAGAAEVKVALTGDNTTIAFTGTKADGKHEGGFKKLTGTATYAAGDPTTLKVEVEIDLDSLYTDDPKLTAHLKSPDFFNVKRNPTAKFVTSKVVKGADGYTVAGDLTLNGKTKAVAFPATITGSDDGLTLSSGKFTINRHDFGISFGKGKIDDDVTLQVKINAKK